MRRSADLPELLAPAGSYEALIAAVNAGADAVYLGGMRHNARAYAHNFDDETLSRATLYAHLHGVRVYVTLNTLLTDRELGEAIDDAVRYIALGADALIVADLGLIACLRAQHPEIELHASTQLSLHNSDGADVLSDMGVSRIVLHREASAENIRTVVEKSAAEVEIFLHGALCVCHSGQCLFSSMVGGRSGNRGECAQPCRLPYDGQNYPLSLKDLCLADHIPSLIESGVASLKIEGRMKSAAYVDGVVRVYRRLLDERRAATDDEVRYLASLFSRSGFTDAYYRGRPDLPMTGIRRASDKDASRQNEQTSPPTEEIVPITGSLILSANIPASLTFTCIGHTVTVTGETPAPALTSPMTADDVKKRIGKLGGTFFTLSPDFRVTVGEGLNLAPSVLNALRRDAVAALEAQIRTSGSLPNEKRIQTVRVEKNAPHDRTARCETYAQWQALSDSEMFACIFAPLPLVAALAESGQSPLPSAVALPPVIVDSECDDIRRMLEMVTSRGVHSALVSNVGHLALARSYRLRVYGDYTLNVTNRAAYDLCHALGFTDVMLSPELPLPALRALKGRVVTYGRIPLMTLERDLIRGRKKGKDGICSLVDRRNAVFPLLPIYGHRTRLYNSLPTYMGDRPDTLREAGITAEHLIFTVETKEQTEEVLTSLRAAAPLAQAVRRLPK